MLVLALDTATPTLVAGLAVWSRHGETEMLAERAVPSGTRHAELLTPAITSVLDDAGLTMADLDAVVTGLGPGPFTGLRVGVVTAAALADARGLPVLGVCSLDAIGSGARTVVTDARRKEIYWAAYDDSGARTGGPAVVRPGGARPAGAVRGRPCVRRPAGRRRAGRRRHDGGAAARGRSSAGRSVVRGPARAALPPAARRHPAHRDQGGERMTVRLRPMTLDDLPRVMVLEDELFAPDTWTEAMYRDELSRPETRYYVVAEFHLEGEDDDEEPAPAEPVMVGYGGLIAYDDEAHVATLGVAKALQGEGVGSLLLDDLLAEADRRSPVVLLEVRADNEAAQRLYLRRGFTEIGRRRGYYQPSGADAVVMRRKRVRALSRVGGGRG